MATDSFRLVLDTNVVVRAFINPRSDSGRLLGLCERRSVIPLLSRAVLKEYRYILSMPQLLERYPQLDRPEIAIALERLTYISDFYRTVRPKFEYPRDPKDVHLIELAIAGKASHIISTDDDLLSLKSGRSEAARRFRQRLPRIQVQSAYDFLFDSFPLPPAPRG